MTILLADDDPLMREHLRLLLEKQGHTIYFATDGKEAVRKFEEIEPSLVILDVVMPELNGYEAARLIKAIHPERFTPLLFLSALHEDKNLMIGIKNGGDDFLTKPVNENLLTMRIYALQRIKNVYAELERYQQRTEEEISTSHHVFNQITQRNKASVPGIMSYSISAGHFCGDLMLVNTSTSNRLYLLHGDFTGHGLSAAIGAIPAADIFYTMSSRDAPLPELATELNRKLNRILPTGKFFACILCCIELSAGTLKYWNGGMPPLLVMNRDRDIHELYANNVALGILPPDSFNADTASLALDDVKYLLLYSDGLLEAWNDYDEKFGPDRLQQAFVASVEDANPLQVINQRVAEFASGHAFDDDITMTFINTALLPVADNQ